MGSYFSGLEGSLSRLQTSVGNQGNFIEETVTKPRFTITPNISRKVQAYLVFSSLYMELTYGLGRHEHFSSASCAQERFVHLLFLFLTQLTTHLAPSDVSRDNFTSPSKMFVRIKASKLTPLDQGLLWYLEAIDRDLCPIAATTPYLSIWGTGGGPLFKFEDGSFIQRDRFVAEVRKLVRSAGIDASYSGHSFRIRAATTAALTGLEDHTIRCFNKA